LRVITVFSLVLLVVLEIWGSVGVWRASRFAYKRGKRLWPILAIIFCLISLNAVAAANWVASRSIIIESEADSPKCGDSLECLNTTVAKKPVIYLYPQNEQRVSVKLNYHGKLISTYPTYNDAIKGWDIVAYPDGHIVNTADRKTYSYLFWEGIPDKINYDFSTGFVIPGKDTAAFLQKTLEEIGLTPREYNEFIVYWLPKMEHNKYNIIHFAGKEYTDTAPLKISPSPDSMLRVFMVFKPVNTQLDIPPQQIPAFTRKGFSVIEWGGTEYK